MAGGLCNEPSSLKQVHEPEKEGGSLAKPKQRSIIVEERCCGLKPMARDMVAAKMIHDTLDFCTQRKSGFCLSLKNKTTTKDI